MLPDRLQVPQYTGAGATSIHLAIRDIIGLRAAGQVQRADEWLAELQTDVGRAVNAQDVVPLMDKWNQRYPSATRVDILATDLIRFKKITELLSSAGDDTKSPRDSSLDLAVRDIEHRLDAGDLKSARALWLEVFADVIDSAYSGDAASLVVKWNARYPSDPASEFSLSGLEQWLLELHDRFQELGEIEGEGPSNEILSLVALGMAAEEAGYRSTVEMLEEFRKAKDRATTFSVHFPPVLERILGKGSPSTLVIYGMPTVMLILLALAHNFPPLRYINWWLWIDGRAIEAHDALKTILPNQRLEIVLGENPAPDPSTAPEPAQRRGPFRIQVVIPFLLGLTISASTYPRKALETVASLVLPRAHRIERALSQGA